MSMGLCAACWARFMCHHELWHPSVSRPCSSLNSSLGIAGGNITIKLLFLYFLDLFFKILPFQVAFLLIFSIAIFSPYFLLVGLLLQYVALFQSGNQLSISVIVNWCKVASPITSHLNGFPHYFVFLSFIYFFLIVTCDCWKRLCYLCEGRQ